MSEPDEQPQRPLLRIVRGTPDDLELAALTAIAAGLAAGGAAPAEPAPRRSAWGSPTAGVRRPLTPGPGAWQAALR